LDRTPDLEKARITRVVLRNIAYFLLSGAALALVVWSFLATARTDMGACGEHTIGPMFPWGVAKPWHWGPNGAC
jgi:hypothetical protein